MLNFIAQSPLLPFPAKTCIIIPYKLNYSELVSRFLKATAQSIS